MGKHKLVSNTSDDLCMPETPRKRFKNGTDGDFQTRMEICVLARRGMSPNQISKTLGCSWDMAKRWSERSEEVMKTFGLKKKFRYRSRKHLVSKKVSVSVSKIFGLEKKSRSRSRKFWSRKKVSVSVSKIFGLEKSLSIGLENFGLKKVSVSFSKILV